MSGFARLDTFQRRRPWAALPIAVVYKFLDDHGTYLAALLAYYGFLSLFPLLLLAVTILGFTLAGDPVAQQALLSSALRNFPVIGDQIQANVGSLQGSWAALVFGAAVALFGALGVTHAAQYALNQIFAVPKADRPSLQEAYGRGFLMVALMGLGLILTTALSSVTTNVGDIVDLGGIARVLSTLLAVALNIGLFLLAYRLLTVARLPVRQYWVGAVVAGVTWQAALSLGTHLLATRLQGATATYGFFGIVFGLLLWIYLAATIFVLCAELDAVLARRLYPRSLSSMDPVDQDTTVADRRAYTSYVQIERLKEHQNVTISFEEPVATHDPSGPGLPPDDTDPTTAHPAEPGDDRAADAPTDALLERTSERTVAEEAPTAGGGPAGEPDTVTPGSNRT